MNGTSHFRILAMAVVLVASSASAQVSAPPPIDVVPLPELPPVDLVDAPTAGMLDRATYDIDARTFYDGGMIIRIRLGISDQLQLGASYGGTGILGSNRPGWYSRPELQVKVRLVDETLTVPAVAIGFDSQGLGADEPDADSRYELRGIGFYAVASKSFQGMHGFGLHAGMTYNPMEAGAEDASADLFLGSDLVLRPGLSVMMEYDAAMDEDPVLTSSDEKNRGYLNVGCSIRLAEGIEIMLNVRDILSRTQVAQQSREFRVRCRRTF